METPAKTQKTGIMIDLKIDIVKIYKLSMLFIAILFVFSFINLRNIAQQQELYAYLINKSGKQRMYFERVQTLLQIKISSMNNAQNDDSLHLIFAKMLEDYHTLQKNVAPLKLEHNIYSDGYDNTILAYLYTASSWLDKNDSSNDRIQEIIQKRIAGLAILNHAVTVLQQRSDMLSQKLINQSIVLLASILIVTGIITFFVFNPLLKHLHKSHTNISHYNDTLLIELRKKTKALQKNLDILNQYVYASYTDKEGIITYVTDAFCELCGYSRDELTGKTHRIIKHPDNPKEFFTPLWQTILDGKSYSGIVKNMTKSGESFWVDSMIIPDIDEKGEIFGFHAYRHDITDKKELEKLNNELESRIIERTAEIEKMATTDQLTGIANRHRFNKEIEEAFKNFDRYNTPFSIAILDIDHFKKINDTFGHQEGDKVLKIFATILKNNIRTNDKIARWGGEEFIILFGNTNKEEATIAAKHLLDSIHIHQFTNLLKITCSIGVTDIHKGDTLETLYQRCDSLLYQAKENGRNQVCSNSKSIV